MFRLVLLATASLMIGGPALAQPVLLTAQQAAVAGILQSADAPHLTVEFDRAIPTYAAGEPVSISVSADRDAFFTIIGVDAAGAAVQLYPNLFQPSAKVPAGKVLAVPGEPAAAHITADRPGVELIEVIASARPAPVIDPGLLQGKSPFRSIKGGAAAVVMATTRVAAFPGTGLFDKVVQTVAPGSPIDRPTNPNVGEAPPNTDNGPVALPGTTPTPKLPVRDERPNAPPADAATLLIATDRPAYAAGETITLAVTVLKPCYLWVIDADATGGATLLFPNPLMRDNRISGPSTVMASGGGSPFTLKTAPPAGHDTIYALCSAMPLPPALGAIDVSRQFASLSASSAVGRDIRTLAGKPHTPHDKVFAGFAWTSTTIATD